MVVKFVSALIIAAISTTGYAEGVRQSNLQPIIPFPSASGQSVPFIQESLRDPIVERSAPRDDMEAARLLEDIKEYQSDISRSQGARRAEMSEKSFEAYAALAVYQKKIPEAEAILLQARLYYRAIKLNIKMYKWERALEIAM